MKKYALFFIFVFITILSKAQLNKDTVRLNPVVVSDTLYKITPYRVDRILQDQMEYSAIRDVGDFLRNIPNISGVRKGGTAVDPVVRGFKFSQLNVILDQGVKIENGCPNRMDPVSSHIEAEDIEMIKVIKGPFALRYGPSFGGVINLVSENPRPYDHFQIHANALYGFETNWNGQREHVSVNGGNKHIYFLLSGGYRDYGSYRSGGWQGDDTTFASAFKKYNYSAKLGWSPNSNHQLLLSFSEIHGRNVLYPALPMDEKFDDTRMIAMDYHARNLSQQFKTIDVKLYKSDVDHVMDNSRRIGWATKQMVADVDATNAGGRAELGLQLLKHNVNIGLDHESISKDGYRSMSMQMMGMSSYKRTNLWKKASISNTGIFAEYTTSISSFEILAMLRADRNIADSEDTLKIIKNGTSYFDKTHSSFNNISASAGLTKKITEQFSVSLAFGRGTRSPNMLERFIKLMSIGYDNYDYLGNPALKPETNNEADLTLNYSSETIGSLYLNGFYSHVQDYISAVMLPASVVMPQTQGVLGVKQFVNVKYATFKGFEFGYNSPEKYKLGGSVVAAYTDGRITGVTKYLITANQVKGSTILNRDAIPEIPPFEATLNLHYKFFKARLIPRMGVRMVAAQQRVSEAFYEPTTPGYYLINFALQYKVNTYASVNAGVNNLMDLNYYEHLNRKIIGYTQKLYEPGRVFFITFKLAI